ncbi:hypothetical protein [Peptoniphilus harei]|uniref:Uncharacterized protein n=1 Tax=Peptoniphilus harei TaxID=54005 RepID=A0A943SP09_9FIRM|nr:hypothetical protein [Peptoniphilus harei]MBS6534282.1 hypothetical protein [Peptoniphilus harei]
MGPVFSLLIGIISLMPAIIFIVIFKVLITILNRGKKKVTEDFYEDERRNNNSKGSRGNTSSDSESLIDEIKRIIKEEKEKEKEKEKSKDKKESLGKSFKEIFNEEKDKSKNKVKEKKDKKLINKDPIYAQRELKEKILEKKSSLDKDSRKSKLKPDKEILEGSMNLEKMPDKIFDSEFIKECESDRVIYEDEEDQVSTGDFLDFYEDDLPKIQIYKEIFDKPLSLR